MYAANHLSGIAAIITLSHSGRTPLLMSRISSGLPIFALSRVQETLNRCALYRGVTPVHLMVNLVALRVQSSELTY